MNGVTYKCSDGKYLSIFDDGSFYVMTPVGVVASGSAGSYMSPDVQNNPKTYHLPDKPPKVPGFFVP